MSEDAPPILASEIRPFPFDVADIQAQIDNALERIPADRNGAIVAVVSRQTAGLAVMARLGDRWSFVGMLDKPWSGSLEAQAALSWSF